MSKLESAASRRRLRHAGKASLPKKKRPPHPSPLLHGGGEGEGKCFVRVQGFNARNLLSGIVSMQQFHQTRFIRKTFCRRLIESCQTQSVLPGERDEIRSVIWFAEGQGATANLIPI
jgi:hypothetical protein